MEETALGIAAALRNLWDLSEPELASVCRLIGQGRVATASRMIRTEAIQLFTVWMEALNNPARTDEDRVRRAALLSGLRKRTIQILVKLSWQG